MVVHRVAAVRPGVAHEARAVDIVDDAVSVVVTIIAGNFLRVHPHVGGKIGMGVVDAGIDDGDDDVGGAARLFAGCHQVIPGGLGVHSVEMPCVSICRCG